MRSTFLSLCAGMSVWAKCCERWVALVGRVIGQVWEDHEGGPIVLHVTMPESDWGAIVTAAEDRLDLLPFDWRDHATLRRPDD
jgi:hypothetical protein